MPYKSCFCFVVERERGNLKNSIDTFCRQLVGIKNGWHHVDILLPFYFVIVVLNQAYIYIYIYWRKRHFSVIEFTRAFN